MAETRDEQRRIERQWLRLIGGEPAGTDVRALVRDSWERCRGAGVSPGMGRAPVVLDESGVAAARESVEWLAAAREVVRELPPDFTVQRHLLAFFDQEGRMLGSEGDPRTRDALAEINFAPGGLWLESAAGTNGPGTALASGRPVHIIGSEHFCEAWQRWHCAAVPVHDPLDGHIAGVLDLSGPWELASPQLLHLAQALALATERSLANGQLRHRYEILRAFTECAGRYPGEALIAADRAGHVLSASPASPPEFQPGREASPAHRRALAALIADAVEDAPCSAQWLLAHEDASAIVYPVYDGPVRIGACLLLRRSPRARAMPATARRATRYSFLDLLGQSPALAEACRIAGAAAANTLPVLILGESGVGKELFAQSIHSASERRDRPFVAVNCGALPRELIESELFGYVGGAFSGARKEGSAGKFEEADGGTIFLDEIGELPPAAQTALLRVLQEGEITRVGGTRIRPVDVRVIAATNRDLHAAMRTGAMRPDLYYRLNVLTLDLPPLRDRREDIPLLARRFFESSCASMGKRGLELDPAVVDALQAYDWPGNVRQLQNVIARLVALASSSRVTPADLPGELIVNGRARTAGARPLVAPTDTGSPSTGGDHSPASAEERSQLLAVIGSARTMREAAERLGVTRSTLYRRLERCGLRPHRIFGGG